MRAVPAVFPFSMTAFSGAVFSGAVFLGTVGCAPTATMGRGTVPAHRATGATRGAGSGDVGVELRRRPRSAVGTGPRSAAGGVRVSVFALEDSGSAPESHLAAGGEGFADEPRADYRAGFGRVASGAERRGRCPSEMSLLPGAACIDRWEASLVQVDADGSERDWSPFVGFKRGEVRVRAVSRPGVVPQGYISGVQAEDACRASGKRLCTASEWDTACRGPQRTVYPYGDSRQPHTCNDDGRPSHPVADVTARYHLPEGQLWRRNMVHPMINQLPDTLLPTGDRAECTNGFGVFDMVGNLHEWIADPDGTFRGGFYMDTRNNGEGCLYATTAHGKQYHDYSTGFRCCSDAAAD